VWDGKDDKGQSVKQDTYSFSMDFIVGGSTQSLGTVIEVRQP
jgi:flagellar hook assembly protein FlgD